MSRIVLVLTLFFTSMLMAQNSREPFFVTIEGLRGAREALQVKADLQMVRDTRYCRGAMIAAPVKPWSCQGLGPGVEKCEREYRCVRVKPELSRISVTKKLIERQRQIPAASGEHKITLRPEIKRVSVALPAPNSNLKERGIDLREESQRSSEIVVGRTTSRRPRPQVAPSTETSDPILNFRQEPTEDVWSDDEDLSALMLETVPARSEQAFEMPDDKPMEKKSQTKKDQAELGLQFLRLNLSYLQAKDGFGESQSTFNIAWTPRYRFANGFGLRGQIGFHQYTLPLSAELEESFTVTDTFVLLQYSFAENWTIEAGLGQQKWGSEFISGVSGTMFGITYELGSRWLDNLSLQTTSLSGGEEGFEEEVSELRISFGIRF